MRRGGRAVPRSGADHDRDDRADRRRLADDRAAGTVDGHAGRSDLVGADVGAAGGPARRRCPGRVRHGRVARHPPGRDRRGRPAPGGRDRRAARGGCRPTGPARPCRRAARDRPVGGRHQRARGGLAGRGGHARDGARGDRGGDGGRDPGPPGRVAGTGRRGRARARPSARAAGWPLGVRRGRSAPARALDRRGAPGRHARVRRARDAAVGGARPVGPGRPGGRTLPIDVREQA